MRTDAWRHELRFVPATLDDAVELQRAIEAAGWSRALALAIPQWLARRAADNADPTTATTRARYRRVLASLPEPPWPENADKRSWLRGAVLLELEAVPA